MRLGEDNIRKTKAEQKQEQEGRTKSEKKDEQSATKGLWGTEGGDKGVRNALEAKTLRHRKTEHEFSYVFVFLPQVANEDRIGGRNRET